MGTALSWRARAPNTNERIRRSNLSKMVSASVDSLYDPSVDPTPLDLHDELEIFEKMNLGTLPLYDNNTSADYQ